ncbi:MAG TPA: hypothetical protein VHN98_03475, partial [Acidimicrobiales bacterium]|nr:hypothetical protein [Acidimicrobiales bacterium]
LGAAAAALVVLVGASVLLRSLGPNGTTTANMKSSGGAAVASGGATGANDAATAAHAPVVLQGDLGEQSDPVALGALLSSTTFAAATTAAPRASSGHTATTEAGGASPTSTPATVGGAEVAGGASAQCVDAAMRSGGADIAEPLFAARLRWRGEDAEVVVFRLAAPSAGGTRQAMVMARSGCALLAVQRF